MAFLNSIPFPPGIGLLAAGGAILVLISSILPWVTAGGLSFSSWRVDVIGLITFQRDFVDGLPLGLLLLGVLALGAPYFTRRALGRTVVLGIGVAAAGLSVIAILRLLTYGQGVGAGFGAFLGAIGGGLVLYEGLRGPLRGATSRDLTSGAPQPPAYPQTQYPAPPTYTPPQPYAPPQTYTPPQTYAAQPPPPPPPPPPAPAAPAPSAAPPSGGARFCQNCGSPAVGAFCGTCGAQVQ
jgi:hypothetical protein